MAAAKGQSGTPPQVSHWEDILEIKDLRSAMGIMKSWNVDKTGIKTLDDVIDRLLQHWIKEKGSFETPDTQKSRGFEHAMVKHNEVRAKLTENYINVYELYKTLTPSVQKNLENSFQGLNDLFMEKKNNLKTGECTILIAGEVGAGKSSLVNLLLGVQLFPTDSVQCTNTICEIRSSERDDWKEARLYLKTEISDSGQRERKVPPKTISLSSLKGIQELKDSIVERNDDGDNPYERIEVYWPFQTLGRGIVIVDTPGIEGGSNVDQRLQKYLCKAFGFIYVINTNAAGGVQRGRLGHLLNLVVNSSEDFCPDASLFIGNKWENIPEKDREDVKRDTFQNLNRIYPGINPHQLQFMSVKKASLVSMKYKARVHSHDVLLQKLEHLIPTCLRHGLTTQYWWLATVLKRIAYLLRVTSIQNTMSAEDLQKKRKELHDHVLRLQKNTDESLARLKEKVDFEMFRINTDLKEVLNSKHMLDRLCEWDDERSCPSKARSWKHTADEAAVKISERLTREIDIWEKQNGKLKRIDKDIVEVFSKELGLMQHQVKELEDDLLRNRGGQGHFFHTMKIVPVKALFHKKKKQIEKTYSTLGGAVSCIGFLDTGKREVRNIFRDYNPKNKHEKMAEAMVVFLQTILNHGDLQTKLRKFFSRYLADIDEAAKKIPLYLKADQQLIDTISEKINGISRDSEAFPIQIDECHKSISNLDILFVNSIMKFDYEPTDLDLDHKTKLGSGAFAVVYSAVIKKKNRPVAIKITKDKVSRNNISDILMEHRIMRDLRHPYVIHYHGASYQHYEGSIQFIMVMEKCSKSLRDVYTGPNRDEAYIPGTHMEGHKHRNAAIHKMAKHAYQLCQGLNYIHEHGYTHRDIKLENVLLSYEDEVKITDVGIAKPTTMLLKTCNGSPAYMAPEVLLGTRNHSDKIDIYSMALILWEMWFGRDLSLDMNNVILGPDFQGDAMSRLKERQGQGDGGYRPNMKGANRPPPALADMMQKGWAYEANQRPSAAVFVAFFKDFLANN